MVVLLAVRVISEHVKVPVWERRAAGAAHEALFVPAAGEAAVGGFDGAGGDGEGAGAAGWFLGCRLPG